MKTILCAMRSSVFTDSDRMIPFPSSRCRGRRPFFYKKPNHTFYSGVARACNELWRRAAKPKGLPFSEPVIRFPAYLAGIASIATIALLLQELEFPLAGVLAAFLSALHPWHIRYASEARAYAFVLCLIPLVLYSFLRALKDGRWRWWVAFSACAFLLMYSYPTCIYVLIVLNLCALPAIWWQWEKTADALTQVMRLTLANVVAAMLFRPLMRLRTHSAKPACVSLPPGLCRQL